jgi:DNA ligase (NAD+)
MTAIDTIESLAAQIKAANIAYRDGTPTISDSDYDQLSIQLTLLDPKHPLLTQVDDNDSAYGVEKPHSIAMGSQQKALTLEELAPWLAQMGDDTIFESDKLDGASLALTYQDGPFTTALTRGDGIIGVDVTQVALEVASIPKSIPAPGKVVVRGEMMLTKSDLALLNAELVAEGREPYQNVRNGAVALMKTLKNLKHAHYLSFKAYDLLHVAPKT